MLKTQIHSTLKYQITFNICQASHMPLTKYSEVTEIRV